MLLTESHILKLVLVLSAFCWSCANTKQSKETNKIPTNLPNPVPEKSLDTLDNSLTLEPNQEIEKFAKQKNEDTIQLKELNLQQTKVKNIAKPQHDLWNTLLQKHVTENGIVNYKNFKNDTLLLNDYLYDLAENSPKKTWPKTEILAYYINLYNAATVKLILDNYPTKSIKDLKNPWGKSWIKTGDGLLSLGDIEHKVLRKMNEPRIHFAINCASFSCPKLLNKAYTAIELEKQLQWVTIDFINDSSKNKIAKEKLELSKLFSWYKKDFTKNNSLVNYIKKYSKLEINESATINYLGYNWNLNDAEYVTN